MTDEAKAARELAKTGGKALDIAQRFGAWIAEIIGPTAKESAGIAEDYVRYLRWKNGLRLKDKVNTILEQRKVTEIEPLPVKLGLPLIDAATLEDDRTLQDAWARLIACALDPRYREKIRRRFITILRDLEPVDVLALEYFGEQAEELVNASAVASHLEISADDCDVVLRNLTRLGCIENWPAKQAGKNRIQFGWKTGLFKLTSLGSQLVEVCVSDSDLVGSGKERPSRE